MNSKCDTLLDRLLDETSPGQDLEDHVRNCPTCRERQRVFRECRASGLPPASPAQVALQRRIVARLQAAAAAGQERPLSWRFRWRWWAGLGSFAVVLLVALGWLVLQPANPVGIMIRPDGTSLAFGLDEPLHLPGPGYRFRTADLVEVEVAAASDLTFRRRRLDLRLGETRVQVVPGTPFRVDTPHGGIRVAGTDFRVLVSERKTGVSVREGRVELQPRQGLPQVLIAGQSGEMIESLASQPPTGTSIPDQNQETPDR